MPTIKVKKKMNLPELLQWSQKTESNVKYKSFKSKSMIVHFNDSGYPNIEFEGIYLPLYEEFTVEVEERIDEDTEFHRLITIEHYGEGIFRNRSINSLVNVDTKEFHAYIDGEFKLIWKNGKLVDSWITNFIKA